MDILQMKYLLYGFQNLLRDPVITYPNTFGCPHLYSRSLQIKREVGYDMNGQKKQVQIVMITVDRMMKSMVITENQL